MNFAKYFLKKSNPFYKPNLLKFMFAGALLGLQLNSFAAPKTLLIIGDSLSAEYGIPRGTGWVNLLKAKLSSEAATTPAFKTIVVQNASISGETTAGGAARIQSLLAQYKPKYVLIELGGNDALRGLAVAQTQKNLSQMIQATNTAKAQVMVVRMTIPPNYGEAYATDFSKMYQALSKPPLNAQLAPFILQDFADKPEFFQADKIHPTAAAQSMMLQTILPSVKNLIRNK